MDLTKYQWRWLCAPKYLNNRATIRTWVKARRIGGSYACAVDALLMAAGIEAIAPGVFRDVEPMNVYIISPTIRQSKSLLEDAVGAALELSEFDERLKPVRVKRTELVMASGCKIVALPGNPAGVRGLTGAVILDEASFVKAFDDLWAAILPIAQGNLRRSQGYPVAIVSTPWVSGTTVHRLMTDPDLCTDPDAPGMWHHYFTDVYEAVADRFPVNGGIEALRRAAASPEVFASEYEGKWVGAGDRLFSWQSLLESLVKPKSDDEDEKLRALEAEMWSIDVGRKHDLTVGAGWLTREHEEEWLVGMKVVKPAPFVEQAGTLLDSHGRLLVDAGGLGVGLCDELDRQIREAGGGREFSERYEWTNEKQRNAAASLRRLLDRKKFKISPALGTDAHVLIKELFSLRSGTTKLGKLCIDTPREANAHADRAWAVLLGALDKAGGDAAVALADAHEHVDYATLAGDLPTHYDTFWCG